MHRTPTRSPSSVHGPAAALVVTGAALLAACGALPQGDMEKSIQQVLVGTPIGDFFTRAGLPRSRYPKSDGSAEYLWESIDRPGGAAFATIDERICRMNISVDAKGIVTTLTVLYDDPGRGGSSRCKEIVGAR